MKKLLYFLIIMITIYILIFFGIPYIWKLTGGSFVWGNEAIYKGKTLFISNEKCSIAFTHELEEVTLICDNIKRTWIKGKEIKAINQEIIIKPQEAKNIIKELDLTGVSFSEMMGKNKNYVTDFNRYGVPNNIAKILLLSKELLLKKVSTKRIKEILRHQGKTLDK